MRIVTRASLAAADVVLATWLLAGVNDLDAQPRKCEFAHFARRQPAWWARTRHAGGMLDHMLAFDVTEQGRAASEPLAYLTGSKAFYGLELHIDARVLGHATGHAPGRCRCRASPPGRPSADPALPS